MLIRRLQKRRFDGCASVDLTIVQASNQPLDKSRIDGGNRRIDSYIDYLKKKLILLILL